MSHTLVWLEPGILHLKDPDSNTIEGGFLMILTFFYSKNCSFSSIFFPNGFEIKQDVIKAKKKKMV